MRARLTCPTGKLKGSSIQISGETIIGRGGAGASASISDDRVSSKHARIFWAERDACFYIEDLGSTNGTTVAGRRLAGSPERLDSMDVVNFGGAADFVFQVLAGPAQTQTASAETVLEQSMTLPPLETPTNVLDPHAPIAPPFRLSGGEGTSLETNPPPLPEFSPGGEQTIIQSEAPALPKLKPRPEEDVTRKE